MKVTVEALFDTAGAPGGIGQLEAGFKDADRVSDVRVWHDSDSCWNAVFTLKSSHTVTQDEVMLASDAIRAIWRAGENGGAGPHCRIVELSLGYGVD